MADKRNSSFQRGLLYRRVPERELSRPLPDEVREELRRRNSPLVVGFPVRIVSFPRVIDGRTHYYATDLSGEGRWIPESSLDRLTMKEVLDIEQGRLENR